MHLSIHHGRHTGIWALIWILSVMFPAEIFPQAGQTKGFSPEKAGFSVRFRDEVCPYRVMGAFVMPGETLSVEVVDAAPVGRYELRTPAGEKTAVAPGKWEWKVPVETGHYPVDVVDVQSEMHIRLNTFVMAPYNELRGGYLNGYRIGAYPDIPLKGLEIYTPPRGFVEVTGENENTLVAPHFSLKQFVSKQDGGYPKYLVLKERLLLKLEMILERVNEAGYRCETLTVMSGYRTPYYNKAIGNVRYSRHVWGGAADIYIDERPKDGVMDDLNRDGKIDVRDAAVLYGLIDALFGLSWYKPYVGGLGQYEKTGAHGPFVHVDVRGFRARWGT